MRNEAWRDFRLYVITASSNYAGRTVIEVIEQAIVGGAQIVQLRNKTGTRSEVLEQAKALRKLTRQYNIPLIINDYLDIVLEVDADGVHLGQEDMPIAEARKWLGPERIIGISTHNVAQAIAAEREGADYIGVGPVYPTDTKPGRTAVTTSYVAEAAKQVSIPFVAIGGITLDNVDEVLEAGATRICAVSAIALSENPAAVCRSFLKRMEVAENKNRLAESRKAALKPMIVNGVQKLTAARTVMELVQQLGQQNKQLIVELDGCLIQRAQWNETELVSGAVVELVHFVGGG